MYLEGVRNEDLLLMKVKTDSPSDAVERQYLGGGATSVFNPDIDEETKIKEDKAEKEMRLSEREEL